MAIEVRDGEAPLFALHTKDSSYVFGVAEAGLLRHLHWGGPVPLSDVTTDLLWAHSTNDLIADVVPQEYPAHGGFRYSEQALRVRFPDGGRELELAYRGHDHDGESLVVHLADPKGVKVDLHYEVLPDIGAIRRWARIEAGVDVVLESVASAQFNVCRLDLTLHNVTGRWAAEFQPFAQTVAAKTVMECRRGVSNHNHSPYVVLSHQATETAGQVWGMALAFSGNTKMVVEPTQHGYTLAQLGINDFDFEIGLPAGESFATPAVIAAYADGFDALSQIMHAYGESIMNPVTRPVLYNSWEATNFDVTCDGQIGLAALAARIGAELFVVDDGWFGRRSPDQTGGVRDGLGDWWVDPVKFPDGLAPLIDEVHALGMRFGIWVEPEMVNPLSDLYTRHPDWIYHERDRHPQEARGQHVLNLTLPEVRDHIVGMLDKLLTDHEIDYLKWDANRPMAQVGAGRDVWYRHIECLYGIVAEIKDRHPGVLIEACASGGGRVDFGALGVFDDFWTSDNTDALDRLTIQEGYSLVYPPRAMRAWVTDVPNFLNQRSIPLDFRFRVAMMGSLGVGCDLDEMSEADLDTAAGFVEEYKALRPLMRHFHRLENSSPNDYRLFSYSAPEGAVLFAYLPASRIGHRPVTVRLRGLDPDATYRYKHDWQERESSGAYLMNAGLRIWLQGDYASQIIRFDKV